MFVYRLMPGVTSVDQILPAAKVILHVHLKVIECSKHKFSHFVGRHLTTKDRSIFSKLSIHVSVLIVEFNRIS